MNIKLRTEEAEGRSAYHIEPGYFGWTNFIAVRHLATNNGLPSITTIVLVSNVT
jgi:hypothetical protein